MSQDETVRAWKDPDLRETLGMPAHPSGEIELVNGDPAGGSGITPPTITPTITGDTMWYCTMFPTCMPENCGYSIGHGTCGWFSYGCC